MSSNYNYTNDGMDYDFSKLTDEELLEFLQDNGLGKRQLSRQDTINGAKSLYERRLEPRNLPVTPAVQDLIIATLLPIESDDMYDESDILSMSDDEVYAWVDIFQLDGTEPDIRERLVHILKLQNKLNVPEHEQYCPDNSPLVKQYLKALSENNFVEVLNIGAKLGQTYTCREYLNNKLIQHYHNVLHTEIEAVMDGLIVNYSEDRGMKMLGALSTLATVYVKVDTDIYTQINNYISTVLILDENSGVTRR